MTSKMDIEFSEREQHILKLLVDHYIAEGQPVGSRTLSRMPGIDISAASVRNVMGDLEQMGLLKSPHTSAGRIPTSKAWRVFVDTMLEVRQLDDKTISEFRTALDPSLSEQNLVKTASSYLSGFTRMAGMVTVPKHEGKAIQQVEFLPLSDRRILAILIMNDNEVQNRIIRVDRDYQKDELEAFSRQLNAEYLGKSLQEVRDLLREDLQNSRDAMSKSMQFMIDVAGEVFVDPGHEQDDNDNMIVAGETNLMRHADLAMYHAKDAGKNAVREFTPTLAARLHANQRLLGLLRQAIEEEAVSLAYQPKLSLKTGELVGCEALIRWTTFAGEEINPCHLIDVAERSGLIIPLGDQITEQAMRQAKKWRDANILIPAQGLVFCGLVAFLAGRYQVGHGRLRPDV